MVRGNINLKETVHNLVHCRTRLTHVQLDEKEILQTISKRSDWKVYLLQAQSAFGFEFAYIN